MPEVGDTPIPKAELRSVSEWIRAFEEDDGTQRVLRRVYGDNPDIIEQRRLRYRAALTGAAKVFGPDRQVAIVRCPARINLRGMHSEMQHASPNYLPHGRELIVVAERRLDDQVLVHNVDEQRFPPRHFRIAEEMARGPWGDWVNYIDSEGVRRSLEAARGDWSNYVKAAVLVLQDHLRDRPLSGMNLMVCGDVPLVGGMSSSSAVVVASALACVAVNGLDVGRKELVILLGRGEWYVGTRGGFGDHGAMLLGKYGCIVHTPFVSVEGLRPEYIEFPEDHQIVIVNSYKTSTKSAEQLFAYNQTIFGYSIALTLIKDVLAQMGEKPDLIESIEYLGQITPQVFGSGKIYRILRALPEQVSVGELQAKHPDVVKERLARFFGQLGRYPEYVEVRGPALWGIAESERSRQFARLVGDGNLAEAGELMYIGQDGDRLFEFDANGEPRMYAANLVSDGFLDGLLADLASNDPQRQTQAQLARQPGRYNSSSFELDRIVDVLRRIPGVIGASLTGAGFGGIVLAIARKEDETLQAIEEGLVADYYQAHERDELAWVRSSAELAELLGDSERRRIGQQLGEIVDRKQSNRGPMPEDDVAVANDLRQNINALFAEGKVSRQMLLIPADYFAEGVALHIPVDGAGPITFSQA